MERDHDIYLEISGDLMRFATTLAGPDEAEDLVSAVMARTLTNHALADLRNPRQYLMKAVYNESKNMWRSRTRLASTISRVGPPASVPSADEGRYPDLTMAVMNLPVQQRAAIYLVHWVGMSSTDAAGQLGCRPATVRRYLHLAREKLKGFADA